jgi:hypothetical protein
MSSLLSLSKYSEMSEEDLDKLIFEASIVKEVKERKLKTRTAGVSKTSTYSGSRWTLAFALLCIGFFVLFYAETAGIEKDLTLHVERVSKTVNHIRNSENLKLVVKKKGVATEEKEHNLVMPVEVSEEISADKPGKGKLVARKVAKKVAKKVALLGDWWHSMKAKYRDKPDGETLMEVDDAVEIDPSAQNDGSSESVARGTSEKKEISEGRSKRGAAHTSDAEEGPNETNPPKQDVEETDPPEEGAKETDPPEEGAKETDPPEEGARETDPPGDGATETNPPKQGAKETDHPKQDSEETNPRKQDGKETNPHKHSAKETNPGKQDAKETNPQKQDAKESNPRTQDTKETDHTSPSSFLDFPLKADNAAKIEAMKKHTRPRIKYQYNPRSPLKDKKKKIALSKQWGAWRLKDPKKDQRPMNDYFGSYKNRDIRWDQFPEGAWQTDADYLKKFLPEAKALVERAMEAMLGEYGWSKFDLPNQDLETRIDGGSFKTEILNLTDTDPKRGRGWVGDTLGGWISQKYFDGLVRRLMHALITQDTFTYVMAGHSAAAGKK